MKRMTLALGVFLSAGAAHGQWTDNFNRPDGPMGPDWTETSGTWAIVNNEGKHTGAGVNTILTHNGANLLYSSTVASLEVFRPTGVTTNAFVALMIGLGGTDAIMVKVQAQSGTENFGHLGIYHRVGTGWGAWTGGLPFGVLQAPFRAGRMTVSFPDPDTLRLEIDTDFNGVPDQTYNAGGVLTLAPNLGTGHGIGAWLAAASFDNWSVSGGGPTGACCRTDGSCVVTSAAGCASVGGIYRGDNSPCATANCPQPPTGACCFPSGCEVRTQAQCTSQGGAYQGDGTNCGTTQCPITGWTESGDAGELPSTAQVVTGSGTLLQIQGASSASGDTDMYQINICNPGSFNATTVGGAGWDTQLWLFNADGLGVTCNDDAGGGLQSILTSQFVSSLPAGNYYLAISGYNNDALDASNALLWTTNTPESQPNGPGAANPVRSWQGGGASGSYTIALQGSCFVGSGPACYANCDGSTTAPILNVNDFICFQSAYAAGASYANCDGSTTPPVLNVNDFICFQSRYAAGCP